MRCVSPIYISQHGLWVPCGKCNFCLKSKRAAWSHRLYQELKVAESAAFLTFTYADEFLVYDVAGRFPALEKSHVQNLFKRIRKHESRLGRKAVRYYSVAENGGQFGRPHYHALIFNLHQDTLGKIADVWGKGFVHHGKVEPASIAYVCGYVINKEEDRECLETRTFPFALMSKGIGRNYLTPQMRRWHKRRKAGYAMQYGYEVPLARYYKDKIFTTLERQTIALEMEKRMNERYVTELARLTALHHDPHGYYREKELQAYEAVKSKNR